MARKYLLYIHDERFKDEPKKSELVNALLKAHYTKPIVYTTKAENPRIVYTNGQDPVSVIDLTKGTTVATRPTLSTDPEKVYTFCKHNAVKGMCKQGCK